MPIVIIYSCWGCGEEKTEVVPSEDQTRSEMIVWNLCPDCIKIEEESTQGITITEAVKKLRGKPGSKVTITIARK